ncbi:MAG: N-methyl-L-tryptophan oxidase [Saprospiraceae bacterium]|nr:N-methyl-L-tryptophan oxidase [Saprospiraceae bacterium]
MNASFDTIIIGAGSMGSSAAYFLSKTGQKVLCLDRYPAPHVFGSHGGQSRIVRKAYFEHPDYVPLLERSYQNWRILEEESGQKLYYKTGLIYLSSAQSEISKGVKHAARIHDLSLIDLDTESLNDKYSQFKSTQNKQILLEKEAGFVLPELTIQTLIKLSGNYGAIFRMPEIVQSWKVSGGVCSVTTNMGIYLSEKLIICPGAWSSQLLPDLNIPLKVSRQNLAWFETSSSSNFSMESFPCFMIDDDNHGLFYGFPELEPEKFGGSGGLKIAHHLVSDYVENLMEYSPDNKISQEEESLLRNILSTFLPEANGRLLNASTCLYTNSPDGDFVLDFLPGYHEKVIVACGFSGHGFKFVPVIGEILSDLTRKGKTDLNIDFLRLSRFA